MPILLIVWHSRTGASEALAASAAEGARAVGGCTVTLARAAEVTAAAMLTADAYLFVGPENSGALSGAMKELLDIAYYPLLGRIEGRAYAHIVAAGTDGTGAARQLARIVTGWRLKAIADPLIVNLAADTPAAILAAKTPPATALADARDLGARLAAGLDIGMF